MGDIKSAWEIAMEKAEKLNELTPEELRKQEEERFKPIGEALARKYLEALNLRQLEVELDKYSDRQRDLLDRILVSSLASAIEMGDYERLEKAIKGISYLEQKELPVEPVDGIKDLFREYDEVRKKAREERERSAADLLSQLGISGSAIAEVNIKAAAESPQILDQIAQPFNDRLERLKQKLLEPPVK